MSEFFPPLSFTASSAAADVTKVLLDKKVWDRVMAGPFGLYFRGLTPGKAWSAKSALILASAFVKWKLNQNNAVPMYFQEVLGDFASEILSRWGVSPMETISSILRVNQRELTEYLEWFEKQDEATQRQSAYEWRDRLVESLINRPIEQSQS